MSLAYRVIELEEQLAAHQLVIQQMREALAMSVSRDAAGRHNAAQQALALQPTTEALEAWYQERRKKEDSVKKSAGCAIKGELRDDAIGIFKS